MASEIIQTEYERKRLENIKRNADLLTSLNIKSKLADLSTSKKRHRVVTKSNSEKKPKSETLTVSDRSLRSQGKEPDSTGLILTRKVSTTLFIPKMSPRELGPISMRDASACSKSDEQLVNKITSACKESGLRDFENKCRVRVSFDVMSMDLPRENVAKVVRSSILSVKFFPSADMRMVAVGNKFGNLGFWNFDSENDDGIYLYHPHPGPVTAIIIPPFSMNKVITSCYDGQIRTLDIEKETFSQAYCSEQAIYSMSQQPYDINSLYYGDSQGIVHNLDDRSDRSPFSWKLHGCRINTIDFNPENTNLMATSSSDGIACIWDLRKISKIKPESIKLITHENAVHSAYFSPSGSSLATTSLDDKIGVVSGPNYNDEFMIYHNNQTPKLLSSFKGVWGWDDSYIFVGNVEGGIDVISTNDTRLFTTFESPHMTAIPCRFDAHPLKAGLLAGATSSGHVYIWNSAEL